MQLIYAGSSSKLFPGNEVIERNKVKILKLHFNFNIGNNLGLLDPILQVYIM